MSMRKWIEIQEVLWKERIIRIVHATKIGQSYVGKDCPVFLCKYVKYYFQDSPDLLM